MRSKRIYLASSWRNTVQPVVLKALRAAGHEVYDFRNPTEGNTGFHWSQISPTWKGWTPEEFREALSHGIAVHGFNVDFDAMKWADTCVLLMPCGRSAHLEAGWMKGAGKSLFILLSNGEPELMYKMADAIALNVHELLELLK